MFNYLLVWPNYDQHNFLTNKQEKNWYVWTNPKRKLSHFIKVL